VACYDAGMTPIQIEKYKDNTFNVIVGDKSTRQLTWEEMLGVVSQLTTPNNPRCLDWLKTKEQWDAIDNRMKEIKEHHDTRPD
jgi:hypothetical protein